MYFNLGQSEPDRERQRKGLKRKNFIRTLSFVSSPLITCMTGIFQTLLNSLLCIGSSIIEKCFILVLFEKFGRKLFISIVVQFGITEKNAITEI